MQKKPKKTKGKNQTGYYLQNKISRKEINNYYMTALKSILPVASK